MNFFAEYDETDEAKDGVGVMATCENGGACCLRLETCGWKQTGHTCIAGSELEVSRRISMAVCSSSSTSKLVLFNLRKCVARKRLRVMWKYSENVRGRCSWHAVLLQNNHKGNRACFKRSQGRGGAVYDEPVCALVWSSTSCFWTHRINAALIKVWVARTRGDGAQGGEALEGC